MNTRQACEQADRNDPLAGLRDRFVLPPGVIYLDGNSLGPLPADTLSRLTHSVQHDWGTQLIGSWNSAGWIDLPQRVGAKLAGLIGAGPRDVICADSTSANLFKLLSAALRLRPDRSVILSEAGNFPTDLYIAQGVIEQLGHRHRLVLVEREDLPRAIDTHAGELAVAMLTQVDYRSGSVLPMREFTRHIHGTGALALWDLAHSAGALPVDLDGADADFAVGCGYKYLNGGPGAPAYVYVAPRLQADCRQPLSGWIGQSDPFRFRTDYEPAPGVDRFQCGTPPILGLVALEAGIDTLLAAQPMGGMTALRAKSLALTSLFIDRVDRRGAAHGLEMVTPRDADSRGSQVSLRVPDGDQAFAVVQALIARGVIGDFRIPDVMRFGFAPLYLRHVDVWDAAEHLFDVLDTQVWREARFMNRGKVT